MFIQAKLILKSYFPKKLEKGMWFLAMHHGQISVYVLGYDIHHEEEKELYLQTNGAPVEPYIYLIGNPNVPDETSLVAEPEQIGWFDEGPHQDELRDITIKEINVILDNGGNCEIEMEEENLDDDEASEYLNVFPTLMFDKVVIRYDVVVLDEEDDEDDYNICGECNGSGEGMTDGSSCPICGGSGEIHEDDDDDEDWEHHSHYDY